MTSDPGRTTRRADDGRGLRLRYIVGLTTIFVVALFAQVGVQRLISSQRDDGRVINVAGRQRMLSQKIAKASFALIAADRGGDEAGRAAVSTELESALSDWRQAHRGLWHGDESMRLPPTTDRAVLRAFEELDHSFQITNDAADEILTIYSGDPSDHDHTGADDRALDDLLKGERAFLPQMHAIVGMYEDIATRRIEAVQRAELVLLGVMAAVLLAVALLVFEPAIRLLRLQFFELRSAAAQAEAGAQAKIEFLSRMSHEIRTPMTAIIGYAELLRQEDQTQSDRLNSVHVIHRQSSALLALINDILDLAKIEAGEMSVEQIRCSPASIVEDAVATLRFRAEEKGLELGWSAEGRVPAEIESDPVRLRQVLVNLVGNAVKFTDEGSVRVKLSSEGEQLVLDVTDTGIGIPADKAGAVFDPFSQADGSTTRKFGGTGLGLSISRQLVEALGGSMELESELGSGSTFRVLLPMGESGEASLTDAADLAPDDQEHKPAEEAMSMDNALEGLRILLAEDGPDNQRLIAFHLRKAGAEVEIAENGQVAVEMAVAAARTLDECFDMIFMDMQMPELDGYDASRELRSMGSAIPIVALTAHAMADDRERCLAAGCDDYLTKPIDRKRLIAAAAHWSQLGRSRRAA